MTSEMNLPTPVMMDGELRVADLDVAETLGFAKPLNIRNLIKRHLEYLEELEPVFTVKTVVYGQPTTQFFLTEEQASYIGLVSQTPRAAKGRIALIRAFRAMKKELEARRFGDSPANAAMMQLLTKLVERVERLEHERSPRPALSPQPSLPGLDEIMEDATLFQPIASYLDLSEVPARRRFIVAGKASQVCRSWLMRSRMERFVRMSNETNRLLFHPEGASAWLAAQAEAA